MTSGISIREASILNTSSEMNSLYLMNQVVSLAGECDFVFVMDTSMTLTESAIAANKVPHEKYTVSHQASLNGAIDEMAAWFRVLRKNAGDKNLRSS